MTEFLNYKPDWKTGISAGRALMTDPKDTRQVFLVMQAMNRGANAKGYRKLLRTEQGGKIAFQKTELAEHLSNPQYRKGFAVGTVGHAYHRMIEATGYSADGLADISNIKALDENVQHPYEWYTRRIRDVHDIWHVLTGYSPDEPLEESCLVAFSYAQTKGLGWAIIAILSMLSSLKIKGGRHHIGSIWEAFRNGRKAKWLPGQDYDKLLNEPLEAARARLNIQPPTRLNTYRITHPVVGGVSLA